MPAKGDSIFRDIHSDCTTVRGRDARISGTARPGKSVNRIKEKAGDILKPQNVIPWDEVRDRLNNSSTGGSVMLCER